MCLSRINVDCALSKSDGRMHFNMLAITLLMPLYKVLQQDMGRKSLRYEGLGTLGIKEMEVTTISFRSRPVSKKYLITEMMSSPIMCHVLLKKYPLKPSGPGALLG